MIKNVVFDVGNVMVCWSPSDIVHRCFALAPETDANEAREYEHCRRLGIPWMRLTATEQARAQDLILSSRGHQRLRWHVPREPWPLGAVWPELHLWAIPVRWPYVAGPVALTARRRFGRRYVVAELRPAAGEESR